MNRLLGTAAIAALLVAALPAAAQQSIYNTNPTPAERAQTQQLNNQAADDARSTPPAAKPLTDNGSDYARQRQDYDAQRSAYDRDRARYRADSADYARRWDAFYGYRGFRDVDGMRGADLRGMRVSARGGDRIGRVRDVDTTGFGRIRRVAVATDGGTVWIGADDLRFDPVNRVVYTDLSRREVDGLTHMPRF